MKLRIWHVADPPRYAFRREVPDLVTAQLLLKVLANYDNYLGDSRVYANAQGLEELKDGEWIEWNDEEGREIHELPELDPALQALAKEIVQAKKRSPRKRKK